MSLTSDVAASAAALAERAMQANARHAACLTDETAVGSALADLALALTALATVQADTVADMQAKALALSTCVLYSADYPPSIEGDGGLAASLIADLLRVRPQAA